MSLFKSTKHTEYCPECQSPLQIKRGKQGLFLGCSAYPQCHYLKPLQQTVHIIKDLTEHCPLCGELLQLKQGHFGIFIGCRAYPVCDFTVHEDAPTEAEFDCPQCKTHKLVKRSGRSGKTFYGCAGYPECRFTLNATPLKQPCPQCGFALSVRKKTRGKAQLQCADKLCRHIFDEPNE